TVLDGAILLISAVEGIQAQTRILMRTLQRLHIPTLLFINKIDRPGAQHDHVLHQITDKLTPAILPMGTTDRLGSRTATFTPYEPSNADFTDKLAERAAEHDDTFLAAYLDDKMSVPYTQLRQALATQTKQAQLHPVFFGSAVTGAGIEELSAGITEFLPATEGDINAPVSGTVFKVERGPGSEKIAYARMFGGQARVRDRLPFGQDNEGKITAIRVFDNGTVVQRSTVAAGQIAKLWGLGDIQIGDPIGTSATTSADHYFAPPTLETVVTPDHPGDKGALHTALTQLAEQDPLINLRQNDVRQEISVSLYGEVQKEVIQTTLADDYHLNVTFRETTTICIERPTGVGAAFELLGIHNFSPHQNTLPTVSDDPNPFLASVGLRIEPAPVDTGVEFRLEIELHGTMPPSFFKAVEETVKEALQQGLCGWQVTDCIVYMTHSGYVPRQSHSHGTFDKSMSSTAGDFRLLTPLVLMNALKRAGTAVYEPIHRFTLEMPADLFGPILPVLGRLRAIPRTPTLRGASYLLEGDIPAAQVHELEQLLPALTRGEGVLESAFDHYQPVAGTVPNRPRTDHNPLNRKEYLLHVLRRV
ncbi:MAG TPA: GTP-binding protein, partial [Mycobacteriales bacterium]|nr:GTP-binding protein [Mycobacteriales bacterium]